MSDLTYPSVILLGTLMGLQHAFEADHLAAVSALIRQGGRERPARLGFSWGVGHMVALLGVGGTALLLGLTIPRSAQRLLEAAVGLMLLWLGSSVWVRLLRGELTWALHRHGKRTHFHAIKGAPGLAHTHQSFQVRAFLVGTLHGMAGTGPLVVLATATSGLWKGLALLSALGLGSAAGMASLTVAVGWPLKLAGERRPAVLSFRVLSSLVCLVLGFSLIRGSAF